MRVQTICFGALVPAAGFRWIYRDPEGKLLLREPPKDWPERDYQAARYYEDDAPEPELSGRFYVAAPTEEFFATQADQKAEFGRLVCEPDLYLRFASARPTPALILEFANRYGLLRLEKSSSRIHGTDISSMIQMFASAISGKPHADSLTGEKAADWLGAFERVRFNLRVWAELQATRDLAAMKSHLEDGFNHTMGGSLTYQVNLDERTGQVHSEVMASSLGDMLKIQWGMSVAANTVHRQCKECTSWFAVHPGSGRPEKQFCSDACRMRAYRKRKTNR